MKHSEIDWPKLISFLKKQLGKPYHFGVENDRGEVDWNKYKEWDCSEIVEIGFYKIGIVVPDGSYNQAKMCVKIEAEPKDLQGKLLLGDLGFKWIPETKVIHHVGIYIGDGQVIEAKGIAYGVVQTPLEKYTASTHFAFFGRLKSIEDA